ncbi:MAG TPA: gamma carbonic anhydrase family protein, partial [bacterium]|nr:gamma carbonic anhydrase family protein [bacterium]
MILAFEGRRPRIAPSAFIAPTATVIGDVTIGEDASVWFGAVLRGDVG